MNNRNSLLLVICSVILMVLSACKSDSPVSSDGKPVIDESQRILDKDAFAAGIKKSSAVIIDVRTPQEFEQSHIPEAVNINFFDPEFKWKILDQDRDKKYYLYCKNENRSYRSMKFMEENGFKHVFMLKGGYEDWNTVRSSDQPK